MNNILKRIIFLCLIAAVFFTISLNVLSETSIKDNKSFDSTNVKNSKLLSEHVSKGIDL